MLFRLSAITVFEIVKDMKANGKSMPGAVNEPVIPFPPAPKAIASKKRKTETAA